MQKSTLRNGMQIVRLVVLMVEVEQPEGISSRKLILETARHNVLTAYSGDGAVNLLQRFPNVDLAAIHTELPGEVSTRQFADSKRCVPTSTSLRFLR
jgi:hypothetical protein